MGKYADLVAQYKQEQQTQKAKQLSAPLRGAVSAANSAMLNWGDELYGGLGALGAAVTGNDIVQAYQENRDLIRGIDTSFREEYPNTAIGTQIAASLPATVYNPLPLKTSNLALTGLQKTGQLLANTGRATATGAMYGGISGAGRSEADTTEKVLNDAQNAALTSGIISGASYPIALGVGGVGRNIYQRTPLGRGSASSFADQKVAEALARSAEGKTFKASPEAAQALINNAGNRAATRLSKLPQGTPLAVAGGESTLDLLDIAAISAGATKQAVKDKQHILTGKESERVINSASKALGTGRPDYNETVEGFVQSAKAKSAPYYAQLNGYQYPIDDELRTIIKRASPFFARSNLAATVDDLGGATLTDALNPSTKFISFDQLKLLRQSLQSSEDNYMTSLTNKDKDLGVRVSRLKNELTRKLDELSPKTPHGDSVHALASGAYAGEMQLKNAVENGRLIFREDAMNIRDSLKNMTQSEKDAFRLGAYQAIYDKAGREGGVNELTKLFKNKATQDRLKAVFGNDYRKFASKLAAEFELKKFQRVAGGSQTAGRQQGLNDLELSPLRDASEGAAALARGNVTGSMNPLTRVWQGMAVPESVRTDMAKTLLLEGAPAQAKLQSLNELVKYINQQKQINAMRFGSTFGQLQGGNQ